MNYDLTRLGITALNTMQQEMLQAARRYRQLVLLAPTGSGKTLAYLLPLLESMKAEAVCASNVVAGESCWPEAVVLVPSRELALQTEGVLRRLSPDVRAMACYGGRPAMDEHRILRQLRPRILIATPGRLLDHLQKDNVVAQGIATLVIDEFDKSLELGFRPQMEAIMQRLTSVTRRILLSATDSPEIPLFVGGSGASGAMDYHRLSFLEPEGQQPERLTVHQVSSPERDKLDTLGRLLRALGAQKSLVFVGYRQSVERVNDYLQRMGHWSDAFHGGMEQRDRERALYCFTGGACNVLVCTDLASRGLDIAEVDNVIHYHLPADEEAYIHRNGRTARWDGVGDAYLLLGPEEHLPEYVGNDVPSYRIPQRLPSPAQPLMATLYIGKGKKDKLSRGDVAGFLTKVGGLLAGQIGRIDVLPGWSYAAVERRAVRDLLNRIKGQKIKGQKTIFALSGK